MVYRVLATTFCRSATGNATNPASVVRPRDVMVNANGSGDVKKPPERWLFHFLDTVERHLRHQLWLVAPEGGVLKPNSADREN